MNRALITAALLAAVSIAATARPSAAQEAPERSIVNIAPDLYRVQNNNHYTVFLVTPEGIIMSDPISRDFATWLKGELQKRFNRPVRYVLYTHHDWDHASGGAVFADTAQFVAHYNFPEELTLPAGDLPLPENVRKSDANQNGRLERGEAPKNMMATFDLTDANKDGALSGAELARGPLNEVHPPTRTFSGRQTVTLGGKTVEMVYLGDAHAPDSTAIYFPKERVVFSADVMQAKRLPQAVAPSIGAYIDAMRTIESLDFDIAATGHAMAGTKADVTALREYLEQVVTTVASGIAAGRTLKEIQQTAKFDAVKGWERGDTQPPLHIAQVYATLKGTR